MIIINILDILNRYTDIEHRLSQKEIVDILEREYSMKVDRKAVKRNLMNLIDFGYPIEYTEKPRMFLNPESGEYEDNSILSDFYIEHEFDNAEIQLLIDSLIFSKHIPNSDKKRLIEKLEGLSNVYFQSKMKHILSYEENAEPSNAIFYTIELLDEAISTGKQVAFNYDEYGTDKKLHHRKNSQGEDREYIINPYQIVAKAGRYYLICNYDKYDNLSNYRLDRISNIKLLDTKAKPITEIDGMKNGLDISKHMKEHVYMFADKTVRAKFIADKTVLNDIFDYFGNDVTFVEETDKTVTVSVNVTEQDMALWAMQFATQVTVISPQTLAKECKNNILKAAERYKEV